MQTADNVSGSLGINGLGRIGKLSLWTHVGRKYFKRIVVNLGREAGTGLRDIAHYLERDSTYGSLHGFLHGHRAQPVISNLDEAGGSMTLDGVQVCFLRSARNPIDIDWQAQGVRLVVETSGQFLDPNLPADHPAGSIRGHLHSGARKVIVSAPFKIGDKRQPMPADAVTTVMGINDSAYDSRRHCIVSNASCTTTCLAHMIQPLLNAFGSHRILSASMATIHAATGSQQVLDRLPKAGATDLRKNRSSMNNIILTTTGAARALALVIPEMENIGFIAESVRIPTTTGSLVILVLNLQEEPATDPINRELLNGIYHRTAQEDRNGYLYYSQRQNVSGDIIGLPKAAAIIEGNETHTRTAEVRIDLGKVPGIDETMLASLPLRILRIPVTQSVIYGWYDNELGSYVNMLADRTISVAEDLG